MIPNMQNFGPCFRGPRCPACMEPNVYLEQVTGTRLAVCGSCGHLYITDGRVAVNLTPSEKERLRTHPNSSHVKASQERIVKNLWG